MNFLLINRMSVSSQSDNLSFDIKDFIQLLQKNQANAQKRRRQSLDSDKLSIIYSASQPESSLADKQNSHNSANKSPTSEEIQEIQLLFKQIKRSGLTSQQSKVIDRLQMLVNEIRKISIINENKIRVIQSQFEQQIKGTDQILKALAKMDEAEKQLWSNYSDLSNRYLKLQQEMQTLKHENQCLRNQSIQNHQDIQFMRKLVLVANQNFQNIEKKCKYLEKSTKMLERFKQQRSSPEITSRSTITHKKSPCSPSISDRSNISVNKGSFQENYRKLVLRTLKSKAIR